MKSQQEATVVTMTVNGQKASATVEPRASLADFLRDGLGLTGTHLGCEHGVCGACTVLVNGEAVRSCLLFAVQAEGAQVATVEGLGSEDELHPIQEAFRTHHALQCGFCTPGFLMTVYELLKDRKHLSEADIRAALSGNLCRCTGYQNIIAAVQDADRSWERG